MHDRRRFLSQGLKLGAAWLVGCKEQPYRGLRAQRKASVGDGSDGIGDSGTHLRPEPALDGGSYQGTLNFVGEDDPSFGMPFNEGLDGRQYTDLSALDEGALLTPSAEFYIRTRTPDRLDREAPWLIRIDGLVTEVVTVELAPLLEAARPMGTYLLECSGNARSAGFGLMSQAEFSGVPLLEVLERAPPTVASARLQVAGFDEHSMPSAGGHSTPGASWIFSQEQLQDLSLIHI
jgi:hypothetical protein